MVSGSQYFLRVMGWRQHDFIDFTPRTWARRNCTDQQMNRWEDRAEREAWRTEINKKKVLMWSEGQEKHYNNPSESIKGNNDNLVSLHCVLRTGPMKPRAVSMGVCSLNLELGCDKEFVHQRKRGNVQAEGDEEVAHEPHGGRCGEINIISSPRQHISGWRNGLQGQSPKEDGVPRDVMVSLKQEVQAQSFLGG